MMESAMKKAISVFMAAVLAGGGLAVAYAKDRKPEAEVRAVGNPTSCVNVRQIRSTHVIDESTIDFKMYGGKTLRNTLPYSCPGLKFEEAFSYKISTSQLCNVDIIRVLRNFDGRLQEGAGCGLGKFQPVEKVNPAS
jgi:hypothetical protein